MLPKPLSTSCREISLAMIRPVRFGRLVSSTESANAETEADVVGFVSEFQRLCGR